MSKKYLAVKTASALTLLFLLISTNPGKAEEECFAHICVEYNPAPPAPPQQIDPQVEKLMREKGLKLFEAEAALEQVPPTHTPQSDEIQALNLVKKIWDNRLLDDSAQIAGIMGVPASGIQSKEEPCSYDPKLDTHEIEFTNKIGGYLAEYKNRKICYKVMIINSVETNLSSAIRITSDSKDFCITGSDIVSVFPNVQPRYQTEALYPRAGVKPELFLNAPGDKTNWSFFAQSQSQHPLPSLKNTDECFAIVLQSQQTMVMVVQ